MKYLKLVLTFFVALSFIMPVNAKNFTPIKVKAVHYTANTAQAEAFKGVPRSLPLSYYKADLNDSFYKSNMSYIKNASYTKNNEPARSIMPSYCGDMLVSYGIRYDNKLNKVYHYNSAGKLMSIEFDNNNPETYPKKTTTYNNKGNLHTVVFYVSPKEQFNFDGKGNLIVHWVGEKAYNRQGALMKIRRSL